MARLFRFHSYLNVQTVLLSSAFLYQIIFLLLLLVSFSFRFLKFQIPRANSDTPDNYNRSPLTRRSIF